MLHRVLAGSEIAIEQVLDRMMAIVVQIHNSFDLDEILKIGVREVRETLRGDRAIVYRFLPGGDGLVAEESVSPEWTPVLGQLIYDPCFNAKWTKQYQQGRVGILEDIDAQPLNPCYQDLLKRLQVRANLVIPILVRSQESDRTSTPSPNLWGLLIVQQCSSPRQWYPIEIKFLQQIALQLGIAIQQIELHKQLQKRNQRLEKRTKQQTYDLRKNQRIAEELRWKEALLRSMTDTSLLGFYVVDNRTDLILYFNHRFCEIWQIQHLEKQIRQGNLKNNDIIPDCLPLIKDVPAFAESCEPLQSEENRCTIEDEIAFVDGRTIRRFSSQIRDTQDRYFGRLYIFEDITQRKLLEKSFRLTDFSMECLDISAIWVDRNAKILRVNEAACQMLGYDRHELDSMHIYDYDPNFSPEKWAEHWQDLKQQKHITFTSQNRKKGGQLFPVKVSVNYVEFDGEEYGFGFAQDISSSLQAETALQESEERYRSVIAAMAEGIVVQQADGRIIACNESAEKILGLTVEQMMGRTSLDSRWKAIHEDGSPFPGETHPAMVTLRTGEPQLQVVMGVHKPDGNLTWISINSQPLFHPDRSQPFAVVTSFTDITVPKQAEQSLQQQTERERMIYQIAHRIRQSLDLNEILNTTVAEVRDFLETDRVIIYRFNPDWSGVVVKESVAEGWLAILNMQITDTYFVERQDCSYQQNSIKVTSDIYTAGLSPCHIELLERLQVRAKLVVPILQGNRLWGLLVAHHCSAPRNWYPWESELLNQLATQVAIAIHQSELHQQLQLANLQLENLAMIDQLTQIANRRCFDRRFRYEWHRLTREQQPLSLLLCDIDYFKQYNDTYGHAAGDVCLTLVAEVLQNSVQRSADLVVRYGGEEFAIILPNTDRDGATQVAQKILAAMEQLHIPHIASRAENFVTLSIGIATVIPTVSIAPLDLVEEADRALYQAKARGRNCWLIN